MQKPYYHSYYSSFSNVPIGEPVRMVVVSIRGEKISTFSSDFSIQANQNIDIKLEETSEEELAMLFKMK